jgi:hypothetical protein
LLLTALVTTLLLSGLFASFSYGLIIMGALSGMFLLFLLILPEMDFWKRWADFNRKLPMVFWLALAITPNFFLHRREIVANGVNAPYGDFFPEWKWILFGLVFVLALVPVRTGSPNFSEKKSTLPVLRTSSLSARATVGICLFLLMTRTVYALCLDRQCCYAGNYTLLDWLVIASLVSLAVVVLFWGTELFVAMTVARFAFAGAMDRFMLAMLVRAPTIGASVSTAVQTIEKVSEDMQVGGSESGISQLSGPWTEDVSNIQFGGAVTQCTGGSCVSAVGEMLTDGEITQQNFLEKLGDWSNAESLAKELNEQLGTDEWKGHFFDTVGTSEFSEDAIVAASRGPMGAVLQAPFGKGHMVMIEPLGDGQFFVSDPLPGVTYSVDSNWIGTYVAAGVYK